MDSFFYFVIPRNEESLVTRQRLVTFLCGISRVIPRSPKYNNVLFFLLQNQKQRIRNQSNSNNDNKTFWVAVNKSDQ